MTTSPAPDVYLPNLSKCFAGEEPIISWDDILSELIDHDAPPRDLFSEFLNSPSTQALLSEPIPTFPPPSPQSKTRFETSTAAINVSPSSDGSYNLEEIKQDSLWLSKEVNIDESEALRITILEWQKRPSFHLEECSSEAESASLRDALGTSSDNLDVGDLLPLPQKVTQCQFNSERRRRSRTLSIYVSERTRLLAVSNELLEIALTTTASRESTGLGNDELVTRLQTEAVKAPNEAIARYIAVLEEVVEEIEQDVPWNLDEESREYIRATWAIETFRRATLLMEKVTLTVQSSKALCSTSDVVSWFECMNKCNFFVGYLESPIILTSLIEQAQLVSATTSVSILKATEATEIAILIAKQEIVSFDPPEKRPYFLNLDACKQIHAMLQSAAAMELGPATPAAAAWGLILYVVRDMGNYLKEEREGRHVQGALDQAGVDPSTGRRSSGSSIGSMKESIFEEVIDHLADTSDDGPVEDMLRSAFDLNNVFRTISIISSALGRADSLFAKMQLKALQDVIGLASQVVGYSGDLVSVEVDLLSTTKVTDKSPASNFENCATKFLKDEVLTAKLFTESANRFPHEALPFLRLSRALLSAVDFDDQGLHLVGRHLKKMDGFTRVATGPFGSYRTVHEEENASMVCLERSAAMLGTGPTMPLLKFKREESSSLTIPAGTEGTAISESSPPVIRWHHEFSCLALFGAWLDQYQLGQMQDAVSSVDLVGEIIAQVIHLLGGLLEATMGPTAGVSFETRRDTALTLLEEMRSALMEVQDVVSVVFEIVEIELSNYRLTHDEISCDILSASINFIHLVSEIQPDRVEPMLARSSLLKDRSGDGALLSVFSSLETSPGSLEVFEACLALYRTLIHISIARPRKDTTSASSARSRHPDKVRHVHLQSAIESQLAILTHVLLVALPMISKSAMVPSATKHRIVGDSLKLFNQVLIYFYGADDNSDISRKATGVFTSSVKAIVSQFALDGPGDKVSPPVWMLLAGLGDKSFSSHEQQNSLNLAMSFCLTLVRIRHLSDHDSSILDKQLIDLLPILVRLFSKYSRIQIVSIDLMKGILKSSPTSHTSSILAHLGSPSSKSFVEVLSSVAKGRQNTSAAIKAWKLLATLVGKNQQWFAMTILTGTSPKSSRFASDSTPARSETDVRGGSLFMAVLEKLRDFDRFNPELASSMLEFVVAAQDNWIWAQTRLQGQSESFSVLTSWISKMEINDHQQLLQSYRNKVAALVVQLSVVQLHHARSNRDSSMIKRLIPFMGWLKDNAVYIAGFNQSLHANLRKNFAAKYPPYTLDNFKRTKLTEISYGDDYFYDVELATTMLFSSTATGGTRQIAGKSFEDELIRANLNLSLVQSRINLFHSFKILCVEHCGYFAQDREVQKMMAQVVRSCLQANTEPRPTEKIFDAIYQSRADFVLALVRALVQKKARGSEFMTLLDLAWSCLRYGNPTFESAVLNGDLAYYRSMLSILLLTMQFHVQKGKRTKASDRDPLKSGSMNTSIPIILDIASSIVVEGFCTIVELLNNKTDSAYGDDNQVGVRDVQLVLSILQTILRLPSLPQMSSQLSVSLSSPELIQSCTMLYSWSHMLTMPELNHEPVFADLSVQFLVSLSSLPATAEELAVEGVLTRLSTAQMTHILRSEPGGVSHHEFHPHLQTLYNVWASGFLPLCLNLLASLGRAMSQEISAFLNQFPKQLRKASNAFVAGHGLNGKIVAPITLALANEAATLALISRILIGYRIAGASAGVDPIDIAPLVDYNEHVKELIDDIEELLEHKQKQLKARMLATNDQELGLRAKKDGDGDLLLSKIAKQLQTALACLKDEDTTIT